jgi:hypothetical protein
MTDTQKPFVTHAQLHRLCCDYKDSRQPRGNRAKARWELYLVVYNTPEVWPAEAWPVSRRHQPPTAAERTEALARLGYAPAPGAEWTWQESEEPAYHGHPSGVSFLGTIDVVPLHQEQAAEGGAR